jgi:hypothetical protein
MVAGGRVLAALVSLSLTGCGWIFPTDDLVDAGRQTSSGAGSGSGSGGTGDDGGSSGGTLTIANAPICPNNQTVGLLGSVDGTQLEPFSGPATSSFQDFCQPYIMDITFGPGDAGQINATFSSIPNQPVDATCQIILPDGRIYCGKGQIQGLSNGTKFYFGELSAGPVCPSSNLVSGSFVGCLNFNFM